MVDGWVRVFIDWAIFLSCQNSLSSEMHQPRPAINVGILLAIVVFVVGGYGIAAVPPSRPRTHQSEARQCSIALWLFRCEAPFAVSLAQVVASDCLGFEPIDRCGSVDAWAGAGERLRALPPNGLTALQAGYLHGGGAGLDGVDQHCHTLVGCNLRQKQLKQVEHLSKRCRNWTPAWQKEMGSIMESGFSRAAECFKVGKHEFWRCNSSRLSLFASLLHVALHLKT